MPRLKISQLKKECREESSEHWVGNKSYKSREKKPTLLELREKTYRFVGWTNVGSVSKAIFFDQLGRSSVMNIAYR